MSGFRRFVACILLTTTGQVAHAQDAVDFAGRWSGTWTNSLGERGDDTLTLTEDDEGNLSGRWSGTVDVRGRRVNRNTIELRGRTQSRSYQITATIAEGSLSMKYLVSRLDADGSYDGSSRFTRE
jgi:hypothetical protein